MRKEVLEKISQFQGYNDIALKNEIVIYGSTYTAEFPFYELAQKYVLSNAIYNRSIEELSLAEAEECLSDCVLDIKPKKVFLALGERDMNNPDAMETYKRILNKIKEKLPSVTIYILPVPVYQKDPTAVRFNEALEKLCQTSNVHFLNIHFYREKNKSSYGKVFKQLTCFFRNGNVTFSEAFQMSH